jgi:outer membrane protein assembly factor BamA
MRFAKSLVFLIVCVVMAAGAMAQQPAQRYPIIAGISVEGLTEGADMATVIAYSGLRIGQEARPDDLVMAVRNLWNRRTFKDVRIERERETALGVFLVIRVTSMPRLRKMIISGNDELSRDEVTKAADRRQGDIISPYDEYLVRQAIK